MSSDELNNHDVISECECNCHKPNEHGIALGWMWCPNCEGTHGVNHKVTKRRTCN